MNQYHFGMDSQTLIAQYKAAYLRANGREITLTYSGGWFTLEPGGIKSRRKDIESAIRVLNFRKPVKKD